MIKLDPGTSDEILDGARDQHLAGVLAGEASGRAEPRWSAAFAELGASSLHEQSQTIVEARFRPVRSRLILAQRDSHRST